MKQAKHSKSHKHYHASITAAKKRGGKMNVLKNKRIKFMHRLKCNDQYKLHYMACYLAIDAPPRKNKYHPKEGRP